MNVKRAFDISRTSFVFARSSSPDFIFEEELSIEEPAPISICLGFFKKACKNYHMPFKKFLSLKKPAKGILTR